MSSPAVANGEEFCPVENCGVNNKDDKENDTDSNGHDEVALHGHVATATFTGYYRLCAYTSDNASTKRGLAM